MSVKEPDVAVHSVAGLDLPSFPVVMRGYDRQQVHSYIEELQSRADDERRRADELERALSRMHLELDAARNQPPPSFEHLGAEAAKVLEQAGASATLLLDEARARGKRIEEQAEAEAGDVIGQAEQRAAKLDEEATQTLNDAGAERDRILAAAAEEAERLRVRIEEEARAELEEAQAEAERIQNAAAAERAEMEAETQRLRESRDHMVSYLGRIHSELGAVLAETVRSDPGRSSAELLHEGEPVDEHSDESEGEPLYYAETTTHDES